MKQIPNLPKLEAFEVYMPPARSRPSAGARLHRAGPAVQSLPREQRIASWVCRGVAAFIMIETLFFKFTGAPESVYIFSRLGLESWWRYGQGIWELLASILLLLPRTAWAGGILTLGALGAAIVSHVTVLGIEVQGDHGLLFGMALVTFFCGSIVTFLHRHEIPAYTSLTPY